MRCSTRARSASPSMPTASTANDATAFAKRAASTRSRPSASASPSPAANASPAAVGVPRPEIALRDEDPGRAREHAEERAVELVRDRREDDAPRLADVRRQRLRRDALGARLEAQLALAVDVAEGEGRRHLALQ